MNRIKLLPLHLGMLKRDKTTFVMGAPSQLIDVPIIMFLVQTPDVNVLIDTGTRDPNNTPPFMGCMSKLKLKGQRDFLLILG